MPNIIESLHPSTFYHIYNHANGDENLFRSDDNYIYFLKKFSHYINPICETYAYCLMPNHFHFLIRIKDEEELLTYFRFKHQIGIKKLSNIYTLSDFISQQFSNYFNSYTKSINKAFDRRGSLFNTPFRRKSVLNEAYYNTLIHYIHTNPVRHKFVEDLESWQWSSYHAFISNKRTLLEKGKVLDWFGGKEKFIYFHQNVPYSKVDSNYTF